MPVTACPILKEVKKLKFLDYMSRKWKDRELDEVGYAEELTDLWYEKLEHSN